MRRHPAVMRGFMLAELAIGAALLTLGAIWMASRLTAEAQDAGARATASYMLTVRGAVQKLLVQYFDYLTLEDETVTPPTYLTRPMPLDIGVADLTAPAGPGVSGFLEPGFPQRPPYGGEVRIRIWRDGACPGHDCQIRALVHTSEPMRATGEEGHRPDLVGTFMLAAQGYGGHAPPNNPERIRGAVFDAPNPAGAVPGIVAVSASLDATMFHQFVRHGETRPVHLRNALEVSGTVTTRSGLHLATGVAPGDSCPVEGVYAQTASQLLAVCQTGVWFELTRYVVQGVAGDLRNGAALPLPSCPEGVQGFLQLGLQVVDVTLDGGDIDVRGTLRGTVSGAGTVGQGGNVTVSGTLDGTLYSTDDSRIRVRQGAGAGGPSVDLSRAGPDARAYAIYGCRHV